MPVQEHDINPEAKAAFEKLDPFFKPEVTSTTLWDEFDKFVGGKHSFRKRGFETKLGVYFKKVPGVQKDDSSRPRVWSGIVLEK